MQKEIKVNFKNTISRQEIYNLAENSKTVNCFWYKSPNMVKKERNLKAREIIIEKFLIKQLKFAKILLILGVIFTFIGIISKTNANDDYKQYLKELCYNHKLAKEISHWLNDWNNAERCYLIWKAQAKFETNWGKLWAGKTHNNIYWFRANWFMYFEDKKDSIERYVNRFFTYDRFKTISQIISWGCYISPIDWIYKCFPWFTFDLHHQPEYTKFVKNYFLTNRLWNNI